MKCHSRNAGNRIISAGMHAGGLRRRVECRMCVGYMGIILMRETCVGLGSVRRIKGLCAAERIFGRLLRHTLQKLSYDGIIFVV